MAEEVERLAAATERAATAQKEFNTEAEQGTSLTSALTQAQQGLTRSLFEGGVALSKFFESAQGFSQLKQRFDEIQAASLGATTATTDGLVSIGLTLGGVLFPKLALTQTAFGDLGKAGTTAGTSISESFGKVAPFFQQLGGGAAIAGERITGLAQAAERVRALEQNLFQAAAASGVLNETFINTDGTLADFSQSAVSFQRVVENTADATNMLDSEVASFAAELAKVPGGLAGIVTFGAQGERTMNNLAAAIKIASGTGLEYSKVLEIVRENQRNFGTEANESLENIANLAAVAQDANLPLDLMTSYISKATSGMTALGDTTDSMVAIMKTLGPALRDVGVGPQGVVDIANQMTGALKNLTLGQQAFIAGAAGGGQAGIGGALEIELLKAEDRFDVIFDKTMTAMQSIVGGPLVDLQEAVNNPQLQTQFLQQVELLKQFGLATGVQDANRVIQAMQRGVNAQQAREVIEGDGAMTDAIDRGTEKQAQNLGTLIQVSNSIERYQALTAFAAMEQLRNIAGTDVPDFIREGQTELVNVLSRRGQDEDRTISPEQARAEGAENTLGTIKDAVTGVADRATNLLTGRPIDEQTAPAGLAPAPAPGAPLAPPPPLLGAAPPGPAAEAQSPLANQLNQISTNLSDLNRPEMTEAQNRLAQEFDSLSQAQRELVLQMVNRRFADANLAPTTENAQRILTPDVAASIIASAKRAEPGTTTQPQAQRISGDIKIEIAGIEGLTARVVDQKLSVKNERPFIGSDAGTA